MNPLVSVIIPVYNHAARIEQSLLTLLKQTYQPLEIIIVNDGSTDNFEEKKAVLKKLSATAQIPLAIYEQKNKGAANARNCGFEISKGEYVIFWDADTIAEPRLLEKMYRTLAGHPEASYAYSQFRFGWKKMRSQSFNPDHLKKNNYIDTTSLLRREAFPGFDEALKRFQDWDLWLTLLEKNKTGIFIPEVLFKKIVKGRQGYSAWIPKIIFSLPFKTKRVGEYEQAKKIIQTKHNLFTI